MSKFWVRYTASAFGILWGIVQLAAGEPFDALVMLVLSVLANPGSYMSWKDKEEV